MKDTSRKPTWQECAAAGMSQREAAEARGQTISGASRAAKRLGIKFRSIIDDPEFAKAHAERAAERLRKLHQNPEFAKARDERAAERLRKLNQNPEFAKARDERLRKLNQNPEFAKAHAERASKWMRKLNQNPKFNPLTALSAAERSDYDALKRAGYTRNEAFRSIGRDDLVKS